MTSLIEALRRATDGAAQRSIIDQLGAQRSADAIQPLARIARDKGENSGAAIRALGQIGDPAAASALIELCQHQALAWIAKDALAQIGPAARAPLIAALSSAHPDARFWAIRALGELADAQAIPALERAVTTDPDPTNRRLALTTLKDILQANLNHANAGTRLIAARGLERLGDARAIEALQPLADRDPDPAVREAAHAAIIALLRGVETNPFADLDLPLRDRATNLAINRVRQLTGHPLPLANDVTSIAADAETVDALRGIASAHPDPSARDLAREAIQRLVTAYLRHAHPDARVIAVRALTRMDGDGAALMARQVAAHDPSETVRQAARDRAS